MKRSYGYVYDVTKFLNQHPGGTGPFLKNAGTDVTARFSKVAKHKEAFDFIKTHRIGLVKK